MEILRSLRDLISAAARGPDRRLFRMAGCGWPPRMMHQQAACITRNRSQAMGGSRVGLTSKVHVVVDANGLPVQLALTAGGVEQPACKQTSISPEVRNNATRRGYDADWIRALTAKKCGGPTSRREEPIRFSPYLYRAREPQRIVAQRRQGQARARSGRRIDDCSPLRTVEIAQIAKTAGFDSFYVDMEHNGFSFETTGQLCMAGLAAGIAPFVRVPSISPHDISRALDGGALGVIAVPATMLRNSMLGLAIGNTLTRSRAVEQPDELAAFN